MKTADFDYHLPPNLIAQTPVEPRDAARLLVYDRAEGAHQHRCFRELPRFLRSGDVVVANDSRVIPARLHGRRLPTGGKVEFLLLSRRQEGNGRNHELWEVLVKPARRLRVGAVVGIEGNGKADHGLKVSATVMEEVGPGCRIVKLEANEAIGDVLAKCGAVPLPPYIRRPLVDPERYQTVYARASGSCAAPTAGLHFTPGVMQHLQEIGVSFAFVTLHIGLDTFRPVDEEDLESHAMHSEFAAVTQAAADQIERARRAGGRVVAAGTTAVRVLESAAAEDGSIKPFSDFTSLFICPGYKFRAVDALITNFHLPRSTLLVLVSAFAGREQILNLYGTAARAEYRFYSFGDAMLIL